ncbi:MULTISPECIES: hypothetical protein [unclassified Mesorhizobium]|uniref:hypothetical protein n=1 Tax=unclassified Mesorhizobium TaxID=325217 RepID=UPI00333CB002
MSSNVIPFRRSKTISRKQLFAEFLREGIVISDRFGVAKSHVSNVEIFDAGVEIFGDLSDFFESLHDRAREDEDPSLLLAIAEEDLVTAARHIAFIRKHFEEMASDRVVSASEDSDRYSACEPIALFKNDPSRPVEPRIASDRAIGLNPEMKKLILEATLKYCGNSESND